MRTDKLRSSGRFQRCGVKGCYTECDRLLIVVVVEKLYFYALQIKGSYEEFVCIDTRAVTLGRVIGIVSYLHIGTFPGDIGPFIGNVWSNRTCHIHLPWIQTSQVIQRLLMQKSGMSSVMSEG